MKQIDSKPQWHRHWAMVMALVVTYVITARLGLLLALPPEKKATAMWVPSGIALAALLLYGPRLWPGIWLGAFLANLLDYFNPPYNHSVAAHVTLSCGIATGSTLQALFGNLLLRRWVGTSPFERTSDAFAFAGVAMAMCLIAATFGTASLYLTGFAQAPALGFIWWTWWLGDMTGVLTVGSLILAWSRLPTITWNWPRLAELALLLVLLVLLGGGVFGLGPDAIHVPPPLAYLTIPILVWATFRFGLHGATTALFLISGIAVLGTSQATGPFAQPAVHASLLLLQVFMGVIAVTALVMAAMLTERQMASERRFQMLLENVPQLIWTCLPDGQCDYISPQCVEYTGIPAAEQLGYGWADAIHPDDRAALLVRWQQTVASGNPLDVEFRIRGRSGEYRWFRTQAVRFTLEDGNTKWFGTNTDIHDKKLAEDQLRELNAELEQRVLDRTADLTDANELLREEIRERTQVETALWTNKELLRMANASAGIGTYDADLVAGISRYSPELCLILGLPAGTEMPAAESVKIVHPDDLERVAALVQRSQDPAGDGLARSEHRIVRPDGEVRWLIWSGLTLFRDTPGGRIPVRAIGACFDITERKYAEQAVIASEGMLRLVLDNIPQGVFWKDRQSRYLGCNRVVAREFGFDAPEMIQGRTDYQLPGLTREQAEFFVTKDRQVMESGVSELGIVEQATLADGTTIWMETNKMRMVDATGRAVGVLGTWQDITARKQAEAALRVEQARYAQLFEYSPIATWEEDFTALGEWLQKLRGQGIQDLRSYLRANPVEGRKAFGLIRIVRVNEAAIIQNGAADQAHLLKMLPELFTEQTYIDFVEELIAIWQGKHDIEYESHSRRLDGSPLHVIIRIHISQSNGGLDLSQVIITGTDITERKQAEAALRLSEERFRRVVEGSLQGILIHQDDQIRYVNPAIVEMFGYSSPNELLGCNLWEKLIAAEEWTQLKPRVAAFYRGEQLPTHPGWRGIRRDGTSLWVAATASRIEWEGRPAVAAFLLDITERRKAQQSLILLRTLIDRINDGIEVIDSDTGRFLDVNENACLAHGYTREEYLALSVPQIDPIVALRPWEEIRETIRRAGVLVLDTQHRRKDGSLFPVEVKVTHVRLERDYMLAVVRDITERKRAEEDRLKLEAQMQHASKLESLGVLAGGIAHDFNNLLTSILGYSELAQLTLPVDSVSWNYIDEAAKGARQAAELTQQMLAYSGRGRFVVQSVSLSALVADIGRLLEVSISKQCVLKYHFLPNLPACEADVAQLRQIIMNLIINASEAIGDRSGVIAVSTGVMHCDRAFLSENYLDEKLAEGPYVYLEVADTGCGMSEETRAKVFDPFFTTKFTGRGLGLAAVLGIVRGHRGTIRVTSELGQGTTFKVLLPASPADAGPTVPESARTAEPTAWRGSGVVLIVEDEESIRQMSRQMMESLGFTVLTATDGREGVEVFRKQCAQIRLVLLDLTMPHLNGEQTFREMKRIRDNVPTILVSGYDAQTLTDRLAGLGLAAFLQKPFRKQQLVEAIQTALQMEAAPGVSADAP